MGFIYALINPSFVDLVKVGRTDRDPTSRVRELSSQTGVPTPYILVYRRFVQDSLAAESFVHTLLERKGFRLSENREFFRTPVYEVVDAMLAYDDCGSQGLARGAPAPTSIPWRAVFAEAEAFRHGQGRLTDMREALKLYKQAARLGCVEAHRHVGDLLRIQRSKSMRADAEVQYREGARSGDLLCYVRLADMDVFGGHECWAYFFAGLREMIDSGKEVEEGLIRAIWSYLYRQFESDEESDQDTVLFRLVLPEDFGAHDVLRKLRVPLLATAPEDPEVFDYPEWGVMKAAFVKYLDRQETHRLDRTGSQ